MDTINSLNLSNETEKLTVKVRVRRANLKRIISTAVVVPVVSSKAKKVYLKVSKANGQRSKEATVKAITEKRYDNFDHDLKAFVKTHADAVVWNSRVATVQPQRLDKAAAKQTEFWKRNGYIVVNAKA